MAIYVDNAIFWAQLRIRGGWKHLLSIALTYAGIVAFSIMLFHGLVEGSSAKRYVLTISSTMVLIVQTVMMLLLAGGAVAGAIRRDIANRQIESNRLMPLSPPQAVVGYIAGASSHLVALCVVNLLVGAVLTLVQGLPVADWFVANAILFLFCLSIWTAMAVAAFVSRAMFGLLFGICACITFSGGLIFMLAPGLLAFCTPMHNRTIFQISSVSRINPAAVVAVGAQFLLGLLCIRGAARKYHNPEAQSITLGPALATLGIWAGLSWFGMTDFMEICPSHLQGGGIDWRLIVIGALASCLLVALLPLAAVAWSNIIREQHRRDGDHAPARPWLFWLCLPVCVLFVISPLSAKLNEAIGERFFGNWTIGKNLAVLSYGQRPSVVMIVCACTIFLVQAYLLMRILYPRLRRANLLLFFIIALAWFGPMTGDVIYHGVKDPNDNPRMDHFALLSPLGTMVQGLDKPVEKTSQGVAAQGCVALLLAMLFVILQVRGRRAGNRPGISVKASPPPLPMASGISSAGAIEPSSG